jgi:hypothetical protein
MMDANTSLGNSIYSYVDNPDRIIFSNSDLIPKILITRVIGESLFNKVKSFVDVEMSRYVVLGAENQIVGASITFKVSPETFQKIINNQDLLDTTFSIGTDRIIYCTIKKFLFTNNQNVINTINEAISFIDVYMKTQLSKYGVTETDFIADRENQILLQYSGKGIQPLQIEISNTIANIKKPQEEQKQVVQPKTATNIPLVKQKAIQPLNAPQTEYDIEQLELENKIKPEKEKSETVEAIKQFIKELFLPAKNYEEQRKKIEAEKANKLAQKTQALAIEERKHKIIEKKLADKKKAIPIDEEEKPD